MTQTTRLTRDPHAGDEAAIRALVTCIVQQAHPRPLAVILFGSRARGDQRPTSDVDLLLVWPEGTNTRHAAAAVDDLLAFAPLDVDIVATTPTRLAAAWGDYGSVLHWAQEQGIVLYRAEEETQSAADGAQRALRRDLEAHGFPISAQQRPPRQPPQGPERDDTSHGR